MKIVKLIAVSTLIASVGLAALAAVALDANTFNEEEGAASHSMPVMGDQQGGMPMMHGLISGFHPERDQADHPPCGPG